MKKSMLIKGKRLTTLLVVTRLFFFYLSLICQLTITNCLVLFKKRLFSFTDEKALPDSLGIIKELIYFDLGRVNKESDDLKENLLGV